MTLNRNQIEEVLELRNAGYDDSRICHQLKIGDAKLTEHELNTIEAIEELTDGETRDAVKIAKILDLPVDYIITLSCEYELDNIIVSKANRINFLKKRWRLILVKKQEQLAFEKRRRKQARKAKETKLEEKVEIEEAPEPIEKIDRLVMQGLPLETMVKESGLKNTNEVEKYLNATDQYDLWEFRHKERTGNRKEEAPKTRIKKPKSKGGKRQLKGTLRHPEIDAVVDEGPSLKEMMKLGNFSNQSGPANYLRTTGQHSTWKAARNKKLGKKPKEQYNRIPKVDELIEKGATLEEMKKAGGWNTAKEPVTYMIKTGQYSPWTKKIREAEKDKRRAAAEKSNQLETTIEQKTPGENTAQSEIPYEKAKTVKEKADAKVREFFTGKNRRMSEKDARKVYTNYFDALAKGEKPFIYQLSYGTNNVSEG